MAIFNVNQNRQFYVINEVVSAEPKKEGQIKLGKTADGKQFFFKHFGKGGLTRTDIIDVDNVCYAKETTKAKMQRKLKKATVTLSKEVNNGLPIAGQDYILRIQINNFFSPGDASVYIKSNAVHATKAMSENATLFYKAMLNSLVDKFFIFCMKCEPVSYYVIKGGEVLTNYDDKEMASMYAHKMDGYIMEVK